MSIKTESYVLGNLSEVEVGNEYYFGQLFEGGYDEEELITSGSIIMYDNDSTPYTVEFKVVDWDPANVMHSLVVVTSII